MSSYKGGKYNKLNFLLPKLLETRSYVEPFCGMGSVFLNKRPVAKINMLNDRDGLIVNLLRQVRDNFEELARMVEYTPVARDEYAVCSEMLKHPEKHTELELANALVLYLNHGFVKSITDIKKTNFAISYRHGGNGGQTIRSGINASKHILRVARFFVENQVCIENKPADIIMRKIVKSRDENMLVYCDPPYIHGGGTDYRYQMTDDDHVEFLELCKQAACKVAISNFENEIYSDLLADWNFCKHRPKSNFFGQEYDDCLWTNYDVEISEKLI